MPRLAWIAVVGGAASLFFVSPALAGSLGHLRTYDTGGFVFGTGIADFDRDGKTDLIVANDRADEGDHLSFLRGRGDGTFRKPRIIRDARGPEGIVVARLNRDRLPDFAVADYDASAVSIFLNRGDGKFKLARKLDGGPGNWLLEAADMDDDGRLDLVSGNYDSEGTDVVSVFLGKGGGKFEARHDYASTTPITAMALGKLDDDAYMDVVTVDESGQMFSLLGDGDGGFLDEEPPYKFTLSTVGRQAVLGRFTAGDTLDVAVPLYSSDEVAVVPGFGNGFFGPPSISDAGDGANGIAGGDFDRDGDLDIAAGAFNDEGVRMLFGPGTGTFDCSHPAPGSAGTQTIEVGRLDGDKRLDVVAGTDTGIDVFLGQPFTC